VLFRSNGAYGPGHNGFFLSKDGTQNWLVYHANSSANHSSEYNTVIRTDSSPDSESYAGADASDGRADPSSDRESYDCSDASDEGTEHSAVLDSKCGANVDTNKSTKRSSDCVVFIAERAAKRQLPRPEQW
jgi:hypothetical protein